MKTVKRTQRVRKWRDGLLVAALVLGAAPWVRAESSGPPGPEPTPSPAPSPAATQVPAPPPEPKPRMDIYGFAMLDMGYQTGQNDPNWFDVLRPTKLPAFENEFGEDGHYFAGVRQSRLGVKGFIPTDVGEIKTIFEFELFGTGVDAGQTTFRLRHAWGELGQVGAGQTWSPFMDIDVFPNSIEYWGPTGMVFFRNVQLRWTPWQNGDSNFMVALERPGASADQGEYAGRIELEDVRGRFPLPDLSAHFRKAGDWGHVQVAGILRQIKWDDLNDDEFDLSGDATGWGLNLSSNLKIAKHVARLSFVYGEGIQNYMNDAPVDIGIESNFANPRTPIVGKALPLAGRRGLPRPQLERGVDEHGRLLDDRHRQQRRAVGRRVQEGPVRARQPPLLPHAGRVPRPGAPVGQARELPGRVHLRRLPHPVLGQVQLQDVFWR